MANKIFKLQIIFDYRMLEMDVKGLRVPIVNIVVPAKRIQYAVPMVGLI